jgi:hypothetical protein
MTKQDKIMEGTVEVCIKVLVRRDEGAAALEELLALAEARPDHVVTVGAYVEPPESDDVKHVVDDVSDEKLAGL